jgi:hypothetical protein
MQNMTPKIRLTSLILLLTHCINSIAQESQKSQMQVMARIVPSCIINTSENSHTPQLYCTQGVSNNSNTHMTQNPSSTINTVSTTTLITTHTTLIVTTIEF